MTGSVNVGVPSAEAAYVVAAWSSWLLPLAAYEIVERIAKRRPVTPTFAVRRAGAKLKTRAVYQRSDIVLSHGKTIPRNGNGRG